MLLSRCLACAAFGRYRQKLMASVPDYLVIETAFTVVQWIIVGPLTALACTGGVLRKKPAAP
jgi:hypothetical protein